MVYKYATVAGMLNGTTSAFALWVAPFNTRHKSLDCRDFQ